MRPTSVGSASPRGLSAAIISVAFLGAVIGGVGAPLITSVALDLSVDLAAAQWSLTVTLFAGAIAAPVLGRLGTGSRRRLIVLVTLILVALGGLLTAVPAPLPVLLVGRALQGLGLGVVPLLMSIARDQLSEDRAQTTIATTSVASTVGIGIAYPLMGLIDELAGLRVAYLVGFLLSSLAVLIAWRSLPGDISRPVAKVDIRGAVLLGIGTFGLLLAIAQPSMWSPPWVGAIILLISAISLVVWVRLERRVKAPLVDMVLFMRDGVLRANAAMIASGVGMYLLFSLLTRYVQTPASGDYGFGLSGVLAGVALIPFSVFGFVAGRLTPRVASRLAPRWTFAVFAAAVILAAGIFAINPDSLWATMASMSVLGFGVGGVSAIMPRLVLDGVPKSETSSVLSINQIVRSIGFSIGSALAGLMLATRTSPGNVLPDESGYSVAAILAVPLLVISCVFVLRTDPQKSDSAKS